MDFFGKQSSKHHFRSPHSTLQNVTVVLLNAICFILITFKFNAFYQCMSKETVSMNVRWKRSIILRVYAILSMHVCRTFIIRRKMNGCFFQTIVFVALRKKDLILTG